MRYKTLALAAAALVAGMLSLGSAQAANVMSGAHMPAEIGKTQDSNIQQAKHRKKWRRHWRRHNGWRGGGHGIFLGLGLAPFYGGGYGSPYYSSYYDDPYGYDPYYAPRYSYVPSGGSRHVRYCLNRYRTYNVRTNTFRGYDGYLHRCRSPYRY